MSTPTIARSDKTFRVRAYPAPLPLRAGDHLDQKTFHERYQTMPPGFRAELIEGVVIVPSPVGPDHGETHVDIVGWLMVYKAATPGTRAMDNVTTILGDDNEVQPDGLLMRKPEAGGRASVEGSAVRGAPELVVEVSHTSSSYDLGAKKRDYQKHGVLEYVVIKLWDDEVKWFRLENGGFVDVAPNGEGIYRSTVFPGLWLNSRALLTEDSAGVLATLNQGLASPEHREFVARLRQALGQNQA